MLTTWWYSPSVASGGRSSRSYLDGGVDLGKVKVYSVIVLLVGVHVEPALNKDESVLVKRDERVID